MDATEYRITIPRIAFFVRNRAAAKCKIVKYFGLMRRAGIRSAERACYNIRLEITWLNRKVPYVRGDEFSDDNKVAAYQCDWFLGAAVDGRVSD